MTKDDTKSSIKIVGFLFLMVLVVLFLLLFFEYRDSQNIIKEQFIESRNLIAAGSLSKLREKVDTDYLYLFEDCDNRSEYDKIIDADSRKLTATELKRALALHKECGNLFSNKNNMIIDLLEHELSYLEDFSKLFGTGENARNAQIVVGYWNDIYEKERERAIIFERLVSIQEEYWINDLNKSLGIITSEGREASVGALNFEANLKLSETDKLIDEIKELRRIESLFWEKSFQETK